MKNIAVDVKNQDMIKKMNETSANLKVISKENDIERALLGNKARSSLDDNDVLGEKKVFGILSEFIDVLKRDTINIIKFFKIREIEEELKKNSEHLPKEEIVNELIKEIKENKQLTAEEKQKLEAQLKDHTNQENVANIVNNNLDRFNSYLAENLQNATEENKEKVLDDGFRKTQLNDEDILASDKKSNKDDSKYDNKEVDNIKQPVNTESRISRMRKS